jgi:hypothetical protein
MADNIDVKPSTEPGRVTVATDEVAGVHYPVYKMAYGPDGTATMVEIDAPMPVADYWLQHAVHTILTDFGDTVSVEEKHKDLLKFGRSEQVQTGTKTTLMTLPAGTFNETYVSDNLITTVSSSSGSDTVEIAVEGHTIDGSGNFTFVSQTITLTGQTQATLTTPLARCTRLYNNNSTDLVGNVYCYQDDTSTGGVPDTASKVHCEIRAGENNSEKAATTISNVDYWIVTALYADVLEKTAANAEIMFEIRRKGKVFREVTELSASTTSGGAYRELKPYIIVPKNADVRLRSLASANGTTVSGGIVGVLAVVT